MTQQLQHTEATTHIFYTRDYTRFKSIVGNRLLNEAKINRIIKDINDGLDMLRYCPIVVDKEMNVIDGQHRLFVARKLKSVIYYVIADSINLQQIARINSNTQQWKKKDYIHCYKVQGNQNYEQLEEFMATYKLPLSIAVQLLGHPSNAKDGGLNGNLKNSFTDGTFKVIHLDRAHQIMKQVLRFKAHPGYLGSKFISAVATLHGGGKCDFDHLFTKFNKNPDELRVCYTGKEYLTEIEKIYNKGQHERKIIF